MDELKPKACLIVYDYRHTGGAWFLDALLGMRYGARGHPYPYGYVIAYGYTARQALARARRKLAKEAASNAALMAQARPVEVLRDCDE